MARRKKRKSSTKKRRRVYRRKNPSPARRAIRSAGGRMLSGLSFKAALKDQIPIQIGMLGAQWAAKRFGPEASELDPSTWAVSSFAKGALGAFGIAIVANMVRPGFGQKVLTGGLAHITHRLIRNKLIEQSSWATEQFGADDEGIYVDSDGTPYASNGGEYLPLDEQHRMLPSGSVGDSLVSPGPLGQLYPVGPLGEDFSEYSRAYSR